MSKCIRFNQIQTKRKEIQVDSTEKKETADDDNIEVSPSPHVEIEVSPSNLTHDVSATNEHSAGNENNPTQEHSIAFFSNVVAMPTPTFGRSVAAARSTGNSHNARRGEQNDEKSKRNNQD